MCEGVPALTSGATVRKSASIRDGSSEPLQAESNRIKPSHGGPQNTRTTQNRPPPTEHAEHTEFGIEGDEPFRAIRVFRGQ
jgi:hypothetical protein